MHNQDGLGFRASWGTTKASELGAAQGGVENDGRTPACKERMESGCDQARYDRRSAVGWHMAMQITCAAVAAHIGPSRADMAAMATLVSTRFKQDVA